MDGFPVAGAGAAARAEWSARHSARTTALRTVALINALDPARASVEGVARVLRAFAEPEPLELTEQDVAGMAEAARALRAVFTAEGTDEAAGALNALLARGGGPLRLSAHGGGAPWHPHLDSDDAAPWEEWFLASSSLALLVLVWDRQRPPGGVCAAVGCRDVYLAQGGGPARRYCSRRCATRERVAAHRRAARAR